MRDCTVSSRVREQPRISTKVPSVSVPDMWPSDFPSPSPGSAVDTELRPSKRVRVIQPDLTHFSDMYSSPSSLHRADVSAQRLKRLFLESPVARTADDSRQSSSWTTRTPWRAGPCPHQSLPPEASRAIQLLDPEWNHIPTMHPPANREALKELDFDCILRNLRLRHDLLFDADLQFRPMYNRKKHDMAECYWSTGDADVRLQRSTTAVQGACHKVLLRRPHHMHANAYPTALG
ncbi:hypothetical protein FISHEDRAFT_73222 [Fistulina hepatica ATCC 64428]|uniref:Uncharacterized protein n=1 Tax=Fistulina hepatica ATCC 64428 TaxID=1128425 RepID=A0A0D7AEQ4_9AGAR|nr:hypothetical protein FISHEDRAFT_73222 [Fistulina hepatica ATCC 64428]